VDEKEDFQFCFRIASILKDSNLGERLMPLPVANDSAFAALREAAMSADRQFLPFDVVHDGARRFGRSILTPDFK